jgi:ABC-2 type transport system ATP-binding protein
MGGEPLLNPQLAEFVVATREAFPQATIRIVTNGLLVRQMTEALCRVLRLQHVIFDISNYPVLEGKCYQIAKFLYEERIPFRFSQPIHQFFKKLKLEGKSDPILANKNCIARTCHFMRDGKISHCGFQQSIQRFGKRFNIELPESQDIYDIYAEELDAWTLCGKLEQPVDLCCFCAEQDVYFDWEIRGRDAIPEDWLVE